MTPRTLIDPNAIPRQLWAYNQFVCWRYGEPMPDKKPPKIPVNPRTLGNAGTSWCNTWTDIRQTVATYKANPALNGIGFVLTERDPFVMLDLDGCLIDGHLSPFASEIVDRLNSYTEYSPSLAGLRLFLQSEAQPPAIKQPSIEIYSTGRWATLTGNVLYQRPIAQVADLDWLIALAKPTVEPPKRRETAFFSRVYPIPTDDNELWQKIFKCNRLACELFQGNLHAMRTPDHSVAVSLLLNSLALWTRGDTGRMARMIRQSALDQSKFDQRRGDWTWLDGRISDSINYMKEQGKL